jgi:archaemetzincin
MSRIALWWIGIDAPEEAALARIRGRIEREFELSTLLWHGRARPANTLDVRRQQHHSTAILRWLREHRPPEATKLLGITDVDLYIPVLTFVYGEAQLNGPCAVVSTARLAAPAAAPDGRLAAARLVKECVHELGHTFGLLHCDRPACVMSRSVNVAAVDAKSGSLCPDCRLQYLERQARQEHDHE